MKTILFPTDFSASADNALSYAISLCEALKAKLVLLNSCYVPAFASQVPIEEFTEEEILSISDNHLKEYETSGLLKGKHLTVEDRVVFGFAVDSIVSEAEASKAYLVIMGMKGASGLTEALIGSNTDSVIAKAGCPVLAVPDKASFHGLKKIVFATDYHDSDFAAIKFLAGIAALFDAEIIIVHVTDIIQDNAYEKDHFNKFKEDVKKEVAYENISFDDFEGFNVANTLNSFVKENKIDMIALSTRNRNIISKLFDKSLTKKMAYHTHIPLLSIYI